MISCHSDANWYIHIYSIYDIILYHIHMSVLAHDSVNLNVSSSSKWVSLYVPSLKEPLEANRHVIDPSLVSNCLYCLISLLTSFGGRVRLPWMPSYGLYRKTPTKINGTVWNGDSLKCVSLNVLIRQLTLQ